MISVCPREYQRRQKTRGRRMECRACDAGLETGCCLWKGVVYFMSCAEWVELNLGETERPVRERFAEHFRDAKNMAVRTPWGWEGAHYRHEHHQTFSVSSFKPFVKARVLAIEKSLPNRRLMEATEIRLKKPSVNSDCGWHLTD